MPALQMSNNLGLAPPSTLAAATDEAMSASSAAADSSVSSQAVPSSPVCSQLQTEFLFELPTGYVDGAGQIHRRGIMRLALTVDEIEPMSDPRVQANPAYATVIILSRVILSLGTLSDVNPAVIERMFAGDLNFLQSFYRQINGLL